MTRAAPSLPDYRTGSGWNALLPPRAARPAVLAAAAVDTAIVGAGFTGVAAARRAAELGPGERILLLESGSVGEGPSGRNAGVVVGIPHNLPAADAAGAGRPPQFGVYEAGLSWLAGIVAAEGIECGWRPAEKHYAAATPAGERALGRMMANYRRWGVAVQPLDRAGLQEVTGTGYYRSGFGSGQTVFVQPAALIRGLADTLPPNVALAENVRVLRLTGDGPFRLETSAGPVTARRVILANNGLMKELGFLRDRLITIVTYAALTPVLPPDLLAGLGGRDEWVILPASRLGSTLRRTGDGRLLVRSAYSYERERPTAGVDRLLRSLCAARFPSLAGIEFAHVWGGATALTRGGAAFVGALAPGLYAAAGCNGSGILKGSLNGKLLAELAMGKRSAELDVIRGQAGPNWLPPEPLRAAAVLAAISYQRLQAGAER